MDPDLSEGQTFGAYRLIGLAGTGGMGVVYQAEQQPPGGIGALQGIRPEGARASAHPGPLPPARHRHKPEGRRNHCVAPCRRRDAHPL